MSHATATAHQLTVGATIGGGGLSLLTTYQSEITVVAVVVATAFSIGFGIWNGLIKKEGIRVNKRNLTEDIICELREAGKSEEYIKDYRKTLRK